MQRTVVISTNNNPDYYAYAPYIEHAWSKLGWRVAIMITSDVDPLSIDTRLESTVLLQIPEIEGLRKETQAQGGRLYAASYLRDDTLIMTSDMDLLPLSDYWNPDPNNITVYGHDLTDFSYYPMGYVAMTGAKWKEAMNINDTIAKCFKRDADETLIAYSAAWEQWWNFDWNLLTARLKPFADKGQVTFINRGRRPGSCFAAGRIDRGDSMQMIDKPWIDAHCENVNVKHPDKWNRFISLFESVYGKL